MGNAESLNSSSAGLDGVMQQQGREPVALLYMYSCFKWHQQLIVENMTLVRVIAVVELQGALNIYS